MADFNLNDYILENKEMMLFLLAIVLSIINTFRRSYDDPIKVIKPVSSSISSIASIFILLVFYDDIQRIMNNLLIELDKEYLIKSSLFSIAFIVFFFCISKILLQYLFMMIIERIFESLSLDIIKTKTKRMFYSIFVGIIRGTAFIILTYIIISMYSLSFNKSFNISSEFLVYEKVKKIIYENDLKGISSSLNEKIEDISSLNDKDNKSQRITYYNGITIDDGIKSDEAISKKANEITKGLVTDREKSKKIYTWIGTNIKYDYDKANKIVADSSDIKSGAIIAFKEKKAVCFDYACLFTAMSKDLNLKSRVIVGEAFNGEEYISHAWNQIYLSDENRWVNVDCTFYAGGNYFDSSNFDLDHKDGAVAGEY